jgi:aspartate/methionine/tyrosine aminotransferase
MVVIADEVYQKNVYGDKPFISFKKVITDLATPYNQLELASFFSLSKGVTGECGLRVGYMELVNMDEAVHAEIQKLLAIASCSCTAGQLAVRCEQ